jgi:hypothetical protein
VSCHADAGKDLAQSETKHHELACIYCHEKEHKEMVDCETCHGQPHAFDIHTNYSDCDTCHKGPHGLIK